MDSNLTLWRTDQALTLGYTKLRMATFDPLHFRLKPIESTITKEQQGQTATCRHGRSDR